MITSFSPKTIEKLKYYVYLYIDPRNNQPFYIGKGKGNRCFAHLKAKPDSKVAHVISELNKLGQKFSIDILKYGLTENEALLVEATAIDLVKIDSLTNRVHGHGSRFGGRAGADELAARLDAKEVDITEPVILITINREYRFGMTIHELYDATRSAWKMAPMKHNAKFALSVFDGIVREVFEIACWVPGGSTMRVRDTDGRSPDRSQRWEFVGQVAQEQIRKKYVGKSVAHYSEQGARNPIRYINC